MKVPVRTWANTIAVQIPKSYAKELKLEDGRELEILRVHNGLLLRPVAQAYTLDELLDRITPANLHGETDWRLAIGRETW